LTYTVSSPIRRLFNRRYTDNSSFNFGDPLRSDLPGQLAQTKTSQRQSRVFPVPSSSLSSGVGVLLFRLCKVNPRRRVHGSPKGVTPGISRSQLARPFPIRLGALVFGISALYFTPFPRSWLKIHHLSALLHGLRSTLCSLMVVTESPPTTLLDLPMTGTQDKNS
jgi:hypothetical protein